MNYLNNLTLLRFQNELFLNIIMFELKSYAGLFYENGIRCFLYYNFPYLSNYVSHIMKCII